MVGVGFFRVLFWKLTVEGVAGTNLFLYVSGSKFHKKSEFVNLLPTNYDIHFSKIDLYPILKIDNLHKILWENFENLTRSFGVF